MLARLLPRARPICQPNKATHVLRPKTERRRPLSSGGSAGSSAETVSSANASRITRFQSRLPRFLQHFTQPLTSAPLSHITAFLLLHEITAIVPLFGLAYTFHYTHYLPAFFAEWRWMSVGVERFGRWFRKKGWLGKEEEAELDREARSNGSDSKKIIWWGRAEGGVRWVVEFATAYAITKALLPLRLMLSVWATPWFARTVLIPSTSFVKRGLGRSKGKGQVANKTAPDVAKRADSP